MSDWAGSDELRPFLRPVESVRPHPRNPRRGDVRVIARSLERFGQLKPLVVADGLIYAGNHTWRAATEQLGWTEIAAIEASGLERPDLEAYLLADNRTADLADYDEPALAELLLKHNELSQGLQGTGYTQEDLGDLLVRVNEPLELPERPGASGDDPERPEHPPAVLHEETLSFDSDGQRQAFRRYVKMIAREQGTVGITATVFETVRKAAADL